MIQKDVFNSIEVFSSKTDELIDDLYFDNYNHDIDLEEEWNINYKKIHELLSRYNIYNASLENFIDLIELIILK